MLGRRSREGMITIYHHRLSDGSEEILVANKHVDYGGRLCMTDRVLTKIDSEGNVTKENLLDVVTLLVG